MPRAAFPRDTRLLRPPQFKAVFARGRKHTCSGFVAIASGNQEGHARIGFALAKRRVRRAVDRNRIKRVARESFRHHQCLLGSVDIVLLARSRTDLFANADLFDQLTRLWGNIAASSTSRCHSAKAGSVSSRELGHPNDG